MANPLPVPRPVADPTRAFVVREAVAGTSETVESSAEKDDSSSASDKR